MQIYLAKKFSEDDEEKMNYKKNFEKKQFEMAIKESQNKNINNINIINQIKDINIKDNINNIQDNINNIKKENPKKEDEFDEEYGICPITLDYMENPVLCPSGVYYEKSAIKDWIEKNGTDPFTREKLIMEMLVEDEEYRKKIIEYRKKFNK